MATIPIKNYVKVKCLLFLKDRYDDYMSGVVDGSSYMWCLPPGIASNTDTNDSSLRILLKRWTKWGLVESANLEGYAMTDRQPHNFYKIGSRGLTYLANLPKWYPYLDDARTKLDKLAKEYDEYFGFYNGPSPRLIKYPACPGADKSVGIAWQFKGVGGYVRWCANAPLGGSLVVADINATIAAIEKLFNIKPSKQYIEYMIGCQKYIAEKAGIRLSVGT